MNNIEQGAHPLTLLKLMLLVPLHLDSGMKMCYKSNDKVNIDLSPYRS